MQENCSDLIIVDALLAQAAEGGAKGGHYLLPMLEESGFIVCQQSQAQPVWRLSCDAGCVVGLDLGGTKLYGALADMSGRILAERSEPTRHDGEEATLEQLTSLVRDLQEEAGKKAGGLRAIGLGVPGFVSVETGSVTLSPNLSLPSDFRLDSRLSSLFGGCPVLMDNDVNFAVLGEYWRGEGRHLFFSGQERSRGNGSLAFLSLGTGIGLGLMMEGRRVRGASGGAGEIAYMPAGTDPFRAARTTFGGAYEDIVGTPGIRRRYGEGNVSVREIFDRAVAGERKAATVIDDTARQVAVGAATIITLLDPQAIVLGGGIGSRAEFAKLIMEYTAELTPVQPRIAISRLGQRAGVTGAIMEALLDIRRAMLRADTSPKRGCDMENREYVGSGNNASAAPPEVDKRAEAG
ncbi:ROK family protein [Martelella mangrovi]|uniref:Glucokinase n=1 Tax=Martelella mangrovi TaxID=1397477 RepID=A0ABV2IGQ8_9HYPH